MKKINNLIFKATEKVFKKRGFFQHEIVTKWEHIVGENVAKNSKPKNVSFPKKFYDKEGATLVVQSNPGYALELQHIQLQVLEKINRFFGFRVFEKIQIVQIPIKQIKTAPKKTNSKQKLSSKESILLKKRLQTIKNITLSHALEGLGTAVILEKEYDKKHKKL
tara:strand:- start:529 stop:1020 length:492 start_codon:yes stop_codon:yes gene_type:complete